ncbi:hypothetical protein QBC43DRAFT_308031 [Cladorrhinum sp. PSN259]|nr:hypothetical protein QBC43DRAFT_308031 [Cladorrhinum sp. PSN259]
MAEVSFCCRRLIQELKFSPNAMDHSTTIGSTETGTTLSLVRDAGVSTLDFVPDAGVSPLERREPPGPKSKGRTFRVKVADKLIRSISKFYSNSDEYSDNDDSSYSSGSCISRSQTASPSPPASEIFSTTSSDPETERSWNPEPLVASFVGATESVKDHNPGHGRSASPQQDLSGKRSHDDAAIETGANLGPSNGRDGDDHRDSDHRDSDHGSHSSPHIKPKRRKQNQDADETGLSCPFRKHDPVRFNIRDHRTCSMDSYSDLVSLKRHINEVHSSHIARICSSASDDDNRHFMGPFEDTKTRIERSSTWQGLWFELFPDSQNVPAQDFVHPIELEEGMDSFRHNLDIVETCVKQEAENLVPESKDIQATLVLRMTRLFKQVIEGSFVSIQNRVRGASAFGPALMHSNLFPEPCSRSQGSAHLLPSRCMTWPLSVNSHNSNNASLIPQGVPAPLSLQDSPIQRSPTWSPIISSWDNTNVSRIEELNDDELDSDEPSSELSHDLDVSTEHRGIEHDDDVLDELLNRITGIVLDYCGGLVRDSETLKVIIRIVEAAVSEFIETVLNEITGVLLSSGSAGSEYGGSSSIPNTTASGFSGNGQQGLEPSMGSQGGSNPGDNGNTPGGTPPGPGHGNTIPDYRALPRDDGPPFICPFRKRNPNRFNPASSHTCSSPLHDFPGLKRHVRMAHKFASPNSERSRFRCQRCNEGFSTDDELRQHVRQPNPCQPVTETDSEPSRPDPEDGITQEMDDTLASRGPDRVVTWHALWTLLFPTDTRVPKSGFIPPNPMEAALAALCARLPELQPRIELHMRTNLPNSTPSQISNLTHGSMQIYERFSRETLSSGPLRASSTSSTRPARASRPNRGNIVTQHGPRRVTPIAATPSTHPATSGSRTASGSRTTSSFSTRQSVTSTTPQSMSGIAQPITTARPMHQESAIIIPRTVEEDLTAGWVSLPAQTTNSFDFPAAWPEQYTMNADIESTLNSIGSSFETSPDTYTPFAPHNTPIMQGMGDFIRTHHHPPNQSLQCCVTCRGVMPCACYPFGGDHGPAAGN